MRLLLIIDTKEYSYHKELILDFENALSINNEITVLDMNCGKPEHEIFYQIRDGKFDSVITIDGAGFSLKNELDGLSLNALTCRMAHLFMQSSDRYRNCFNNQMNFSMYIYMKSQADAESIMSIYPDAPNVAAVEGIIYKNISETDHENNVEIIKKWFENYRKIALLQHV